uniref:Flagellar protein n=1 Tax=Paenibacillus athensensis TaxID=1967502 RepID=A0A4Y8Q3V8_9BACL
MCSDCTHDLDGALIRCLDFLRKNHKATAEQVSEATGVPGDQLLAWIKENKVMISDYPNLNYPCATCAKPIRKHKMCTDCLNRINKDIRELKEKDKSFAFLQARQDAGRSGAFQISDRFRRG